MVSHALSPVTGTWNVQHEFFDCPRDIVCIWYNGNRNLGFFVIYIDLSKLRLIASCDRCHA